MTTENNMDSNFTFSAHRILVYESIKKCWYKIPEDERTPVRLARLTGIGLRKLREEYLPMIKDEEMEGKKPKSGCDKVIDDLKKIDKEFAAAKKEEEDEQREYEPADKPEYKPKTKTIKFGRHTKEVPVK